MVTISNPNYLFRFFHIQERKNFFVYSLKLNATSTRFDLFNIDLPNDIDLKTGEYKYFIYENDNAIDLDYETMTLLEQGRSLVSKAFPSNNYYTIDTNDNINYGS